jgi:type I restriction enzyme, R subunit
LMVRTPEEDARENIDAQLDSCGWTVQDRSDADLSAALGVAIREFPLKGGDEVDYLLYADEKAIGIVEAKREGHTLTGVEIQSEKYLNGLDESLPAYHRPLPFAYESTGIVTHFTNGLDPYPRSREVFTFHRPETLIKWATMETQLRERLTKQPPLITDALWNVQRTAITNLENSLRRNRPRSLIQMATGSGKTFCSVNFIYRLIKNADARRVLFLVDRSNLGRQTLKEFQKFVTPDDGRKFTELYNVQHLKSNKIDDVCRVCITTIQRLYAMLQGEELDPSVEEESTFQTGPPLTKTPVPVEYNPAIPIETFDFIVTDECHRSIYNLWRQVLDYFDSFLIGLTATPSQQTIGFFKRNLVMEYTHDQAVADGVNVGFDVYRIRTRITESGSTVDAENWVDKRDRLTRAKRWEQLDEDLHYGPNSLDRDVVAKDQIRTVIQTFRDRLFTEIFPGRSDVPKTLIFAKDDSHADDIVTIVREEFDRGNEFCQKITYKTTGRKPEDLIQEFRNSYEPRIVVTVDMIATGTDIKPLEVVFFMRMIRSRLFFEQMKGRGVRVMLDSDFQGVTRDAKSKTHFVIVDAVGVCESCKSDSRPLDCKKSVSLEKLLEAVAFGNTDEDVISTVAARLARLNQRLSKEQKQEIIESSDGKPLTEIVGTLIEAIDPDKQVERAQIDNNVDDPSDDQVDAAAETLIKEAVKPIKKAVVRNKIIELKRSFEQTIDNVSTDEVLDAGFDANAREAARNTVASFEAYIAEHRDEITALEVLYNQPYRRRLTFAEVKELAKAIEKPPHNLSTDKIWHAYQVLERSKVRGSGGKQLTDIVSLVRYALHHDDELSPFAEVVDQRFETWVNEQEADDRSFTPEQRRWLELIRDHVAASMSITADDFGYTPFNEEGGIGRVFEVFGDDLDSLLDELNRVLAA